MKRRNVTQKRGFGILEVLLAGVIIITILGALVVLGKTVLNNLALSAQRSQATFLAQQGIELVREVRDTNYIDQDADTQWNSLVKGVSLSEIFSGTYAINYSNPRIGLISDPDGTIGTIKTYDGNEFTRIITFKKPGTLGITGATSDETNAIIVTCKVIWGDKKSVSIDEMITNSHPNF